MQAKAFAKEIRSHDQDPQYAPGNATLVAVDIAKRPPRFADRSACTRAPATLPAWPIAWKDFERLADYLRRLGAPAVIAFEATGNYHRSLA